MGMPFRTIVVWCLLSLFLLSPLPGAAQDSGIGRRADEPPDPMAMAVDLVIARPVGLLATAGGTVLFVLSFPFAALGGNPDDTFQSLVASPANYTFTRPLGEFE